MPGVRDQTNGRPAGGHASSMNILGIETSCDETAASVVSDGTTIHSSIVSSQVAIHHPYGGVVPELASRKHMEAIVPVVREAIAASGIADRIDAVAVTRGPGLVGALLVGFCYAKAYAYAQNLPWIGVNHLEGHINSVFLIANPPPFPYVALLVSGGHTSVYHVTGHTIMECLGQTRDDAAGEAYDKVAKMLGLGYPGGNIIDTLAREGDPARIAFPRAYLDQYDFSFSGLKTAVSRYIQSHQDDYRSHIPDIAASFQEAVVDVLTRKIMSAAADKGCAHIAVVGGVAANNRLRERVRKDAAARRLTVHIPPVDLCGDNAAMIAAIGYHYLEAGIVAELDNDAFSRAR